MGEGMLSGLPKLGFYLVPTHGEMGYITITLFPNLYTAKLKWLWRNQFKQLSMRWIYFSRHPEEINVESIGEHSYSANEINVHHVNRDSAIRIGNFVSIGLNLKLICIGGHRSENLSTYAFNDEIKYNSGDIDIGNDVWIGDDVTIFGGVNIGDGVVIGANSLVRHNLEAYGIYAGVPAKLIRYRFKPKIIKELKELKWWNIKYETLLANIDTLYSANIDIAIKKLKSVKQKE